MPKRSAGQEGMRGRPLVLGTPGEVHCRVEPDPDGESVTLQGADGLELRFTRRGAGMLGRWLVGWAMPPRVLKLWGVAEICDHYGVTRGTVDDWRSRPRFPVPVARLRMGPVFEADAVKTWRKMHVRKRGRPRKS